MSILRSGLEEIDINVDVYQYETIKEQPPNLTINCQDIQTVKKVRDSQWIVLIVDCWQALRLAEGPLQNLVVVTKTQNDMRYFVCFIEKELLPAILKSTWAHIQLQEPIFKEELLMDSQFHISSDRMQVTIFAESTTILLKDIERNLHLFQHDKIPLSVVHPIPQAVHIPLQGTAVPQVGQRIVNYEVQLNKNQVTYLIGRNGVRIEMLRKTSQATIKILPIAKRLTEQELNHPESVNQSIIVTGELYEVALAFACIESYLRLHQLGPRKILL
ncbi:uncharacterized protein ZBIST_2379 [Zygosaccharomyces bailii]|nr:uncharacterized protein ZBIST_2379 [Zygosaccharomyces bailii]